MSLGHSVILPAVIGGQWADDLDVSSPESPYLAFIVGLHVATAAALLLFFWRVWVRIVGGFSSIRYRRIRTDNEGLAWRSSWRPSRPGWPGCYWKTPTSGLGR